MELPAIPLQPDFPAVAQLTPFPAADQPALPLFAEALLQEVPVAIPLYCPAGRRSGLILPRGRQTVSAGRERPSPVSWQCQTWREMSQSRDQRRSFPPPPEADLAPPFPGCRAENQTPDRSCWHPAMQLPALRRRLLQPLVRKRAGEPPCRWHMQKFLSRQSRSPQQAPRRCSCCGCFRP